MGSKTFVIAEAGVNHNGSLDLALKLVDAAVEAGADAVKFQMFQADELVLRSAEKAEYQKRTTDGEESQYDMLKRLELSPTAHQALMEQCQKRGILFLSTPFDLGSLDFLSNQLRLPILKIPSGEITNPLLLLAAARSGKNIILSTGMSVLSEVETALAVLAFGYTTPDARPSLEACYQAYHSELGQEKLRQHVTLLHCTSEYPAPYSEVNLRAMDTLQAAFGLRVGLSDHTLGIAIPIAAVARGASVIEKHFTLDKNLPGPDHKASLDPQELSEMVQGIRQVETALGSPQKRPSPSEWKNRRIARKSLIAIQQIGVGETLSEINMGIKRPGTGLSPMHYWDLLGKQSPRSYLKDDLLELI